MEEEILLKSFIINETNYIVVREIDYNEKHYVYLSNSKDDNDIMIRIVKDGELIPLDSDEELKKVLEMMVK